MKNKKFLTNQEITIMSLVLALMFVIGKIFETQNLGGLTLTVIKINPVEGFIIVPLALFGFRKAMIVAWSYLLLMAVTGTGFNATPAGIGFIAMALALNTYIFGYLAGSAITRPLCIKEPYRGIINLVIASLIVTIVMTIANWLFISPSFFTSSFTTVFDPELGVTPGWMLTYILTPGPFAGILHGNLMKYGLCSFIAGALLFNRKAWKYKTYKAKSKAIR